MSITTLRVIGGATTVIGGVAIGIVTKIGGSHAALINAIIMLVMGGIDQLCTLFIKAKAGYLNGTDIG